MSPYHDVDVEDILRWSYSRININGDEVLLLFFIIAILLAVLLVVTLPDMKDSLGPLLLQPSATPSHRSASRRDHSVTLYSPKTQTTTAAAAAAAAAATLAAERGKSAKRRYVSTHRVIPSYLFSGYFWNMIFVLFPVCRRHNSSNINIMPSSWMMLRQSRILSFHPAFLQVLPKVTAFTKGSTSSSPTFLSPTFQRPTLSNHRVMQRSQPPPIGYHTAIIRRLSSSSSPVISDDGTIPSTKPPKRTPRTTKRSVSAVAVPRMKEDVDDDPVSTTDSKEEDASVATLATTTTTPTKAKKSRTKMVKETTKVESSAPKTSKKSKNVMTPPPSPPSHMNDTPSFHPHVGGIYGMVESSYSTVPLHLAPGLAPIPNATTATIYSDVVNRSHSHRSIQSPHSSSDTESRRVSSTTTAHSHSDGHVSPDYIVLSRTPIPTTTDNNNTNANQDAGGPATKAKNDVVVPDSSSTSTSIRDEELLNPYDLIPPNATTGEWRIPYPKSLSPSSIKEFQSCPQSFLFQYILGLRQPTTTVLAKGSMCHAALERIFDIEPPDRSLSVLQNLFRTAWSEQRSSDTYRILFEEDVLVDDIVTPESDRDGSSASRGVPVAIPVMERRRYVQRERSWGLEGLALLQNYWMAEDASSIQRPNPVQREVWVKSNLPLVYHTADDDPQVVSSNQVSTTMRPISSNVTRATTAIPVDDDDEAPAFTRMFNDDSGTNSALMNSTIPSVMGTLDGTDHSTIAASAAATNFENSNITKFLVRGIVDRLDMVQDPNNKSEISLRLIDYKSGKAPDLKYSPSMNLKIQNEAFDQLLIYALLLREANRNKVNPMPLRYLRLFYLTSVHAEKAIYWDMDLGATQEERDALLRTVHVTLSNVYRSICQLIDQQDFTAFVGCQRSFCYCHKCRPKFKPGTVWEPPSNFRK